MRPLRPVLLFVVLLSSILAHSQCGPYVGHPIFPDDQGIAFILTSDCDPFTVTSVLWDNGSTDWQGEGLVPGQHSVVLFDGNDPVDTLYFEVEQLQWQMGQSVLPMGGAMSVNLWAELDYCGTQILNYHKCTPDPDSTVIYLLQDGIAIDSVEQVSCPTQLVIWNDLPFGYTYQTYLVDHGSCGSYAYGELVSTFSLEGANLDILVEPSTNGSNGSIEVLEVVPDPNSTLPQPPSPITGTFTLMELPDYLPIADQQTGTTAYWDGLAAGDYMVIFNADSLSDPVIAEVMIDISTGVGALSVPDRVSLWPVPVSNVLYWSGHSTSNVSVLDLQGRVVLQDRNMGWLDVSALSAGSYILNFQNGVSRSFVKE